MTLRDLPSVDRVLGTEGAEQLIAAYGRPLTVQAVRASLEAARGSIQQGRPPPNETELLAETGATLRAWLVPTLVPTINATGVVIHTNLGRAPLSRSAIQSMREVAAGYSSLEYDLGKGVRGNRDLHAEELLVRLTGAAAALVVNNNAAAVLLALSALAQGRDVLVSRTQLIEIGGGFRIPEIMEQSGAALMEVGTTNRTHLKDFEGALSEDTALILRAHHSNFKIIGFSTEPSLSELVDLGREKGIPVLDDLGSGALLDTTQFGLGHEPMVQESVLEGASLTAFSGDKLIGGPQAGIMVGDRELIDGLKRHPMARAVRPDKLCLAALTATLQHYVVGDAETEIPIWTMISASESELRSRTETWRRELKRGRLVSGRSTVGGGSLPEETLPTWLLALSVSHPNALADKLRDLEPPIVARIQNDQLVFDPRTVLPHQEADFLSGVGAALERATG